ncbi:3-hydroxyacyl-ACP dehydratase FabZ [Thermodesulforhabdus norvegica]|uniref:3-hydroxyacyl-[acyl-carrier-protein] dehydratase FabZ n=1 Tax=Thermodesulforhabdus norvegica TaxID=39841 RepID=A0A1I4UPR4_9BACT|nr:3-hydroxyacyl-ACP dehydratase FabZ [Thermodesulforhabdus norvegica]SFM90921.1 3-hydroxyacyl-[acyl-carrier-protein] dehydratase [Thermodesulforhabdus norvegica]
MTDEQKIQEILNVLPHRYPFLMIDRVLSVSDDEAVAIKNVSINEPFFQGHFPDEPIMPGVLIVEALAQLGGIFAFRYQKADSGRGYFMGMDKVRFRKPVYPGDQIKLQVRLQKKKGSVYRFEGTASVDGHVVCEAELLIIVKETLNE